MADLSAFDLIRYSNEELDGLLAHVRKCEQWFKDIVNGKETENMWPEVQQTQITEREAHFHFNRLFETEESGKPADTELDDEMDDAESVIPEEPLDEDEQTSETETSPSVCPDIIDQDISEEDLDELYRSMMTIDGEVDEKEAEEEAELEKLMRLVDGGSEGVRKEPVDRTTDIHFLTDHDYCVKKTNPTVEQQKETVYLVTATEEKGVLQNYLFYYVDEQNDVSPKHLRHQNYLTLTPVQRKTYDMKSNKQTYSKRKD